MFAVIFKSITTGEYLALLITMMFTLNERKRKFQEGYTTFKLKEK
jgi:hypothetical protein